MSGFADLAAALSDLDGIPSRASAPIAARITESIRGQFDAGIGPNGRAWAPLLAQTVRRKGGDDRILRRSDKLSSETVAKPLAGAGVEITSVEYGQRHQGGTRHMVARPILPEGEIPEEWHEAIEDEIAKAFRKVLK